MKKIILLLSICLACTKEDIKEPIIEPVQCAIALAHHLYVGMSRDSLMSVLNSNNHTTNPFFYFINDDDGLHYTTVYFENDTVVVYQLWGLLVPRDSAYNSYFYDEIDKAYERGLHMGIVWETEPIIDDLMIFGNSRTKSVCEFVCSNQRFDILTGVYDISYRFIIFQGSKPGFNYKSTHDQRPNSGQMLGTFRDTQ